MAITRIKNNQITDAAAGNVYLGVNAASKVQDYSVTAGKIANNLTYDSNFTITGNLTVQGNTTTIDTVNLVVEDPLILLAKEQTGSPTLDIGFIGQRGTSDNIAFVWVEGDDQFATIFTDSITTNTTANILSYASLRTLDLTAATANVTGNVDIGGNVTVTGNITGDISFSGNITAGNLISLGVVSAIANVSGGNVTTAGVVEATGNVIGGNIVTAGDVTTNTVTATANVSGGNLTTAGAVDATGNVSGGNLTTGGAVEATGNVDGGNVNAVSAITAGTTISATGNVAGGNLTTAGAVDATGNITGGNLVTAGDVSGATGTFSGNVSAANLNATTLVSATTVTATGNVNGGNINSDSIVGGAIVITATSVDMELTGNLSMSGRYINDLGTPSEATDAATKQYVDDSVSAGIHIHTPVDVETPVALPAATYNQGGTLATVTDTIAGNTVVFSAAINPQVNDQLWFANSFEGVVANIAYFVVSAPNTSAAIISTQYNGTPVANITSNTGLTESVRVNSGYGANLTANATGALTVDGYSVSAGNRVLVYNQNNAVENGIYVVTDAGNGSASWVLTRSDDANSYIPDSPTGLDEGSYVYVKYGDTGAGESYVMTAPQGPFNIGAANVVFTQFSASQVYTANTQAGLVLNGTVFSAKVDDDTTAFDGGGNIIVKASANLVTPNIGAATGTSLNITGNLDAGNVVTGGAVDATGNVTGGNLVTAGDVTTATVTASGNVSGGNITTGGIVVATGNVTGGNITTAGVVAATGNVDGGNVNAASAITAGTTIDATGNITGGNLLTGGLVSATGNVSGGNITTAGVVEATGNVSGGNITTAGQVEATGNITGGNIITTGQAELGNIVISGDDITGTNGQVTFNVAAGDVDFAFSGTAANVFYIDAGTNTASFGNSTQTTGALVSFNTSDSILIPVGNTLQRPSGVTGMIRFNTSTDSLEYYDNDSWTSAGTTFTVIVADEFVGNGVQTIFTLSEDSTTAGTIVAINGVVQIPTTAYSVTGNSLQFTEAPEVSDVIDARILTTTTQVISLTNSSGNALLEGSATESAFLLTGNLLPSANVTYNLGSPTAQWNNAYFNGTTIFLGDLQLKQSAANTFGVFTSDGSTPAAVDAGGDITVGNILNSNGNGVGNIGNATSYFNTVFAKATSAQYADLAEMYEADAMIDPGTVVCFGGNREVTLCGQDASRRVAGVVSTNPSYIMNAGLQGEYVIAVALTGRVPCRVTGTVRKGDMMVATGDGRARAEANPLVGSVIGKALADFEGAEGVIEVVVGRL